MAKKWEFPYGNIINQEQPVDPQYLKDVRKLFNSNGVNGWWWYEGCKLEAVPIQFRKTRGKY
tara:strand:- start:2071 stop:2256 length:186 start_codon:yes stop_codon:yes gene_type:complete